jgi:hypothetical protein
LPAGAAGPPIGSAQPTASRVHYPRAGRARQTVAGASWDPKPGPGHSRLAPRRRRTDAHRLLSNASNVPNGSLRELRVVAVGARGATGGVIEEIWSFGPVSRHRLLGRTRASRVYGSAVSLIIPPPLPADKLTNTTGYLDEAHDEFELARLGCRIAALLVLLLPLQRTSSSSGSHVLHFGGARKSPCNAAEAAR